MKQAILFFVLSYFAVHVSCNHQDKKDNVTIEKEAGATGDWLLGAGTYTFHRFSFLEALDKVDSCGLKYIEVFPEQELGGGLKSTMDYHMDSSKQQLILKKLQEKGLTMIAYGVVAPKSEADWKILFEFGKAMSIRTFTSEPNEKDLPYIATLCDEYGINLAIHNHPWPKHYWHPDTVLHAIKGLSQRVGACADVGHWVRSDLNAVDCLKQLEGHILHVHMKDLAAIEGKDDGGDNRDVRWGTGVVNFKGVMQELKRQHFTGMISAEYETNWLNNVPDVIASVENFRKTEKEIQ